MRNCGAPVALSTQLERSVEWPCLEPLAPKEVDGKFMPGFGPKFLSEMCWISQWWRSVFESVHFWLWIFLNQRLLDYIIEYLIYLKIIRSFFFLFGFSFLFVRQISSTDTSQRTFPRAFASLMPRLLLSPWLAQQGQHLWLSSYL